MHTQNDDVTTNDDLQNTRSVNADDVTQDDIMPPIKQVADEDKSDDTDEDTGGELSGAPRLADDVGELKSINDEDDDETHIPDIHSVGAPAPQRLTESPHASPIQADTSHADRLRTIERDLSDARSQLKQAQTDFQVAQDRVKTMEETVTRLKGDALHALETYKSSLIDDPSANE